MRRQILIFSILFLSSCSSDDDAGGSIVNEVSVFQDKLTGCEYLRSPNSLIPRLDSSGRQVCREPGAAPWKQPPEEENK